MHIMHNMHIYGTLLIILPKVYRVKMLPDSSKLVRDARRKLELNQVDFASKINKTQSVLSRYECGKVIPPSKVIMHCVHILNDESSSADIEQIITKVRALDGEQHMKVREALNTLLDKCIQNYG